MDVLDTNRRGVVKNWPANCIWGWDFATSRKELPMFRVAPLAVLTVVFVSAAVANAQVYTTYYQPATTTAYYQPATVYYAPARATTVAYAPAPAEPCCCGTAQPAATTTYYAPTTYVAPTTTYYAAAPTVVYYPAVPRYRTYFRWW
jgi:hypothetical protein